MFELLFQPFIDYGFMQRALLGCLAISISAAPIGVFLMLRRMSLTGDAMAHAILPGAAVGYLVSGLSVGAMTVGGIVAGCLVAMLSGLVSRSTQVAEDSSMAAFYLISLALGVLIISTNGSQVDLLHVLFGSALALNDEALILLASISTITLVTLALIFRPLVLECMDSQFLRSVSRLSPVAHILFLLLCVINLVAGFNALGTLMAVGMMILPSAATRYWFKSLDAILAWSIVIAISGCYIGLLLSFHANWPAGSAIVLVLGLIYIGSFFTGVNGGIITRLGKPKHLSG